MALGRIVGAWAAVAAWLVTWVLAERRWAGRGRFTRREAQWVVGEVRLLALFGALWFGSLGAGAWWLVFLVLGTLMECLVRAPSGAARITRVVSPRGPLARTFAA